MKWSNIVGFFSPSKKRGDLPDKAEKVEGSLGKPLVNVSGQVGTAEHAKAAQVAQNESSKEERDVPFQATELNSPNTPTREPPQSETVAQQPSVPAKAFPAETAETIAQLPSPTFKSEKEQNEAAWAAVRYTSTPSGAAPVMHQASAAVAGTMAVALPSRDGVTISTAANVGTPASGGEVLPFSARNGHLNAHELAARAQNATLAATSETTQVSRFSKLYSLANRWNHPLPQRQIFVPVETRAEARRLAPVVRTLHTRFAMTGKRDQICVCAIGDRTKAVKDAFDLLGLAVDCEVGISSEGITIDALRARVLNSFEELFAQVKPEWMVLAGNTLISGMAALAAYYAGVQVARLETNDGPQPETSESNNIHRQLVDLFSSVHFTETVSNKDALVHTGLPSESIFVVGNTGIDALLESCSRLGLPLGVPSVRASGTARVFISLGEQKFNELELREVCRAVGNLSVLVPGLYHFVWSLPQDHQPAERIRKMLKDVPGIELLHWCDYEDLLRHLASCDFVLTDSVDIQEEAPSLGKPVLMLGPTSDRSEAVRAGVVVPVAPLSASIQSAVRVLARKLSTRHGQITNPYGDGKASSRIADFFEGRPVPEFGRTASPRLAVAEPENRQLTRHSTALRFG